MTKTTFLGREAQCELETAAGRVIAQLANPDPTLFAAGLREMRVLVPFEVLRLFRPDGSAIAAALGNSCP